MPHYPNVAVVGMHFRGGDAKNIAASLEPGETLRLEREPENQFDSNAIKVFYEALWIGYIEAGQAAWIATEMDEPDAPAYIATVTGSEDRESRGKTNTHPIVTVHPENEAA